MIHRRAYPDLKTFLKKTGTSQRAFAEQIGVDPAYVSYLVHGQREPSLTMAAKIAQAANIPIESLLLEKAS